MIATTVTWGLLPSHVTWNPSTFENQSAMGQNGTPCEDPDPIGFDPRPNRSWFGPVSFERHFGSRVFSIPHSPKSDVNLLGGGPFGEHHLPRNHLGFHVPHRFRPQRYSRLSLRGRFRFVAARAVGGLLEKKHGFYGKWGINPILTRSFKPTNQEGHLWPGRC